MTDPQLLADRSEQPTDPRSPLAPDETNTVRGWGRELGTRCQPLCHLLDGNGRL